MLGKAKLPPEFRLTSKLGVTEVVNLPSRLEARGVPLADAIGASLAILGLYW